MLTINRERRTVLDSEAPSEYMAETSNQAGCPCPLCGGTAVRQFSRHEVYVADCESCGHRFADLDTQADHVGQHYGDEYFTGGGAGYTDYLAQGHLLRRHGQRYARILSRYAEPGTMADIGSAAAASRHASVYFT